MKIFPSLANVAVIPMEFSLRIMPSILFDDLSLTFSVTFLSYKILEKKGETIRWAQRFLIEFLLLLLVRRKG